MNRFFAVIVFVAIPWHASCFNASEYAKFENPDGAIILLSQDIAVIQGKTYLGHDCSTRSMYCVDYSGYFSIIAPKSCRDIFKPLRVDGLARTPLGSDHHRSRSMYGVNRGEMVAYLYSWYGAGVVGLAFDSIHKVANFEALQAMGYRDPSIFYEKTDGADLFPCVKNR